MKKFLSWIKRGFRKNEIAPAASVADGDATNPQTPPPGPHVITGIEWVDNDGLLRDEGVLFGIAEAGHALKIESIKSSFDKAKSSFVVIRDQLKESILSAGKEEEKCLGTIAQTQQELMAMQSDPVKGSHHLLPGFLQLLMYIAICFFNYYLLIYWLKPVFPAQPYIPIGMYLFGLLSVFMGKALVYNSGNSIEDSGNSGVEKRERWKVFLEEMGIPFIVSVFICTLGFRYYPVEWNIAAFAFFLFLFSFSGKGLVNLIHINYRHLKLQAKHWKMVRGKKIAIKKQLHLLSGLEKKKEILLNELKGPQTRISELDALFVYKVKVFESEYNLARESRAGFSGKQLSSF